MTPTLLQELRDLFDNELYYPGDEFDVGKDYDRADALFKKKIGMFLSHVYKVAQSDRDAEVREKIKELWWFDDPMGNLSVHVKDVLALLTPPTV